MKKALPLLLLAVYGCVPAPQPKSPPLPEPDIEKLTLRALASVPADTNSYFEITLAWDYPWPTNSLTDFRVAFGGSPGHYTNSISAGLNLSLTIDYTNWPEEDARHWFVVYACHGTNLSLPSNEIHFPFYPPDHIGIAWHSNWPSTTILCSTNLIAPKSQWQVYARITGTNQFTTNFPSVSPIYFVINHPDTLRAWQFNPFP